MSKDLAGAVTLVRAQTLLLAVAALGVVGYGVGVVFLLFGGPDLALTQFAIETLSVLLFVLVLRRLPPLRVLSPRSERILDGVVAVAGGAFVTALVLAATAAPHPAPLREYFAATSLALANERNVVMHRYQGIPTVVTHHPAYLLRNLPDKARAW